MSYRRPNKSLLKYFKNWSRDQVPYQYFQARVLDPGVVHMRLLSSIGWNLGYEPAIED